PEDPQRRYQEEQRRE
nr:RecName: Full=Antifungal protein 3; AltName: Full=CW-3 [Malva parviflora]